MPIDESQDRENKKRTILDLLHHHDLTVEEIEQKTAYDRNLIWVYISQFKREGRVVRTGKKRNNFSEYTATQRKELRDMDTQILKKLVVPFAKAGIKVDLNEKEQKRIKQIFQEVNPGA